MFKNHCSVSYKSVTIYFNNIQVQFKFKFSRHTKFNRFIMYSLRIQYLPSKIIHFSSMRLLLLWILKISFKIKYQCHLLF